MPVVGKDHARKTSQSERGINPRLFRFSARHHLILMFFPDTPTPQATATRNLLCYQLCAPATRRHVPPSIRPIGYSFSDAHINAAIGGGLSGSNAMEWFKRKTTIAGYQISNWIIVLGAIIIVLLIFQNSP
jgi:hypothetical protein